MKIIINENQFKSVITESRVKQEERIKLYEDDKILVVVPLTHKASCKYGAYTKWCTSTPSNADNFTGYAENGALIYFIIRSPYPESKIKEYKFSYYKSFDEDCIEADGWYDMSDYQFVSVFTTYKNYEDEEKEEEILPADLKLIKFLIPDFIFEKVKEYIKIRKKEYLKEQKNKLISIYNLFISDPDNHVIVNDDEWLITYRINNFSNYYYEFNKYLPKPEETIKMVLFVMFINKSTNKIYYGTIVYYSDIRNFTEQQYRHHPDFYDFLKSDKSPEIMGVFMKYLKQISKTYFKCRKLFFDPKSSYRESIYLMPEFVTTKDYIENYNGTIISITKRAGSYKPYKIDVKDKHGKIHEDIYYSMENGVSVKYDKERHNPE